MGVDYSSVSGFGIVLNQDEIEKAFEALGMVWNHCEAFYDLEEKYDFKIATCGNAYHERGLKYLCYAKAAQNEDTGATLPNPEQVQQLKTFIQESALNKKVTFQKETYIH